MSDINLDFTVSNNNIDFTVNTNDITFTPTDVQLLISTGGLAAPSPPLNSVQYNKDSTFKGDSTFAYIDSTQTLGVQNLVLNGTAYIHNANTLNVGVSNIHISGGTNGYVLQTDGTGNLNWTAMSGGGGNGSPGGANTQIQFNDSGLFGGVLGFTFNKVTGNVNIPGNIISTGNITGNIITGTLSTALQPNITSIGTLSSLTVQGLTSIQEAKEKVTIDNVGSTGTINFDILDQAILYKSANTTSNFAINVRGNSTTTLNSIMNIGESFTCTLLNTVGTLGGYISTFYIDGNLIIVKWPGGAPTSGILNSINSYTFNIIKTASNTYTVLGSLIGFE